MSDERKGRGPVFGMPHGSPSKGFPKTKASLENTKKGAKYNLGLVTTSVLGKIKSARTNNCGKDTNEGYTIEEHKVMHVTGKVTRE